MSPSKRLKQLREDVRTCHDPFELAADLAYELERVKGQLREKEKACECND